MRETTKQERDVDERLDGLASIDWPAAIFAIALILLMAVGGLALRSIVNPEPDVGTFEAPAE